MNRRISYRGLLSKGINKFIVGYKCPLKGTTTTSILILFICLGYQILKKRTIDKIVLYTFISFDIKR